MLTIMLSRMQFMKRWICAIAVAACGHGAMPPAEPVVGAPSQAEVEAQEQRDQPVTEADLRILRRADEILASEAVWNRHDTRDCPAEATTWSLFCALQKASLEVLGEYRHRAVALQEVRFAVEDATKGIELQHRMMDYNNLATTRFEDIKRILAIAIERVQSRLAAQAP